MAGELVSRVAVEYSKSYWVRWKCCVIWVFAVHSTFKWMRSKQHKNYLCSFDFILFDFFFLLVNACVCVFSIRFVFFLLLLWILSTEACSHGRSHQFFAASIFKENVFTGYPCSTYETYKAGGCKKQNGIRMGDPVPKTARGIYYLQTSSSSPYAQGRWGLEDIFSYYH